MKSKLFYSLAIITLFQLTSFAQGKKSFALPPKKSGDDIVMTWNKNTPESEMNDDVKALGEHGVIITYSDVKRNDKGEITALTLAYTDKSGSKGSMSLDNQKPINTIKFYKQGDEVGFGEPSSADFMSGSAMTNGFNPNDMMKGFNFNDDKDSLPGQQYHFEFPNGNAFGQSSAKTIIQKEGKKPLVIENGNVVEGGDDYTKEELEEIKKNNKVETYSFSGTDMPDMNFGSNGNGFGNMAEQMKKMQDQINQMMSQQPKFSADDAAKSKSDLDQSKEEMLKAKEEMQKAKEEMESAKKELQKAKSTLKTQKA